MTDCHASTLQQHMRIKPGDISADEIPKSPSQDSHWMKDGRRSSWNGARRPGSFRRKEATVTRTSSHQKLDKTRGMPNHNAIVKKQSLPAGTSNKHVAAGINAGRSANKGASAQMTNDVPRLKQEPRFLPITLRGVTVLVHTYGNTWRVDNSMLQSDTVGLGYRWSKQLNDKDELTTAEWWSLVKGIDTGDGWLQTDVEQNGCAVSPSQKLHERHGRQMESALIEKKRSFRKEAQEESVRDVGVRIQVRTDRNGDEWYVDLQGNAFHTETEEYIGVWVGNKVRARADHYGNEWYVDIFGNMTHTKRK